MKKPFEKLRVLVVDDNEQARKVLMMVFERLGIEKIFTANDGLEAQNLLAAMEGSIDLILCDWNMPVMSGMDLLRQIRWGYPDLPFIMVTANSDLQSARAAKEQGATDFIAKPVTAKEVEERLRGLFEHM
ncbi:MAG: response regulator [Alphaproteobacteria bacterium]|nr:response regulator [Alphaproteobacteria bacterium]